jgi:ABC-type multidrug transport system ATPase subunit
MRTNLSPEVARNRTEKLLTLLNLEENANKIVGGLFTFTGISAKERKRTALAVELITDPHLIFLDEPTSGLDSENAYIMINMLKRET